MKITGCACGATLLGICPACGPYGVDAFIGTPMETDAEVQATVLGSLLAWLQFSTFCTGKRLNACLLDSEGELCTRCQHIKNLRIVIETGVSASTVT